MTRSVRLLWILLLSLGAGTTASGAEKVLHWAGCGITKKAFMAELARAYELRTGVKIVLDGGGATKGIRRVADRSVAIGGSCRARLPDTPEERGPRLNPVAWDALTVIVHPSNPVSNITLEQLRALFEGRITNWKELGGPDRPIELLARKGRISGVGRTLRELVFHDVNKEFAATRFYPSSGPLEKAVEENPNAIAVTGVSSAHKRKVKLLALNGKKPTYANIRSGEYLLYRPLYITYNSTHPQLREVLRFIDFAHSREGREIIRRAGSVPYLDALHLIRNHLDQRRRAGLE